VQRAPAPVAQPAQSQPAPIAAAPLERDFDAELAELKAAQAQLNVPPKVVQTTPFRARPPAPPVTPPSSASAAGDPSASHDLADAFERARKQAEQHARDEAIRIQQEARERRMRDQRKPK